MNAITKQSKEWAEDMNKHFSSPKEDIQIVNRYLKSLNLTNKKDAS